jgi:Protein tyrosine and serine/threonine kinase
LLARKDHDGYLVKVADFGLSRSNYYQSADTASNSVFPVKWSAPEVMEYEKFSTASDAFSFAVTAWEIFSLGRVPWMGMSNSEAMDNVLRGERLARPDNTPEEVWEVMCDAWKQTASNRPTFTDIFRRLKECHVEMVGGEDDEAMFADLPASRAGLGGEYADLEDLEGGYETGLSPDAYGRASGVVKEQLYGQGSGTVVDSGTPEDPYGQNSGVQVSPDDIAGSFYSKTPSAPSTPRGEESAYSKTPSAPTTPRGEASQSFYSRTPAAAGESNAVSSSDGGSSSADEKSGSSSPSPAKDVASSSSSSDDGSSSSDDETIDARPKPQAGNKKRGGGHRKKSAGGDEEEKRSERRTRKRPSKASRSKSEGRTRKSKTSVAAASRSKSEGRSKSGKRRTKRG